MEKLSYAVEVAQKLTDLSTTDSVLHAAAVRHLAGIKDDPDTYGSPGPGSMRVKSFPVAGRDEEYVITWERIGGRTRVVEFESTEVLLRLAAIERNRRR